MDADNFLLPGEDLPAWAVRTGRFRPERAAHWRAKLDAEQRRIVAAGGDPAQQPSTVAEEIRRLTPVLAAELPAAPVSRPDTGRTAYGTAHSATPRYDALRRQVFGPTPDERAADQDAELEARLAETEEQERIAASAAGLTRDEYRALFGDD